MKKVTLAISLLLSSAASFAAPFQCTVDVLSVLVYSNGNVNIRHSGRGDYTVICSLKEEYQGVSIPTCAMWTSMLLTHKNANKKVDFYYDNQYANCASLPTYGSAPVPVYIGPVN